MPRLVKGGKWVYGWMTVGPEGEGTIPQEAQREYNFRTGDEVVFLRGSRRSGGFGLSTPKLMTASFGPLGTAGRVLGRGLIGESGQIRVPPEVGIKPGDRLLVVRGSRYALGFVARGPIYEEARKHPDEFINNVKK
jgi:hypothetical protein